MSAEWLATKARSYNADARRLGEIEDDMGGLTGAEWAIVYRAVAEELRKCAADISA